MSDSKNASITPELVEGFNDAFFTDPKNILAMNITTTKGQKDAALDRKRLVSTNHHYSVKIKKECKATNQKSSGRCWLFACLNALRLELIDTLNLEKVELSQSYLFFWDKFEKANFLLENMLELIDEDESSRLISWLLKTPVQDGGQYDMIINIVKKYGICPKDVYPESHSSSASRVLNRLVTNRLREFTWTLRKLHRAGKSMDELRDLKQKQLEEIYRILVIHLGEPPKTFNWTYTVKKDNKKKKKTDEVDEKKKHGAEECDANDDDDDDDNNDNCGSNIRKTGEITPLDFYQKYFKSCVEDHVSLIHDPRNDYNKLYTVQRLGNVVEGRRVNYINVPIEVMKKYTRECLEDNTAVWFGCDVGKFFDRPNGLMDLEIFDYNLLCGTQFNFPKAERLRYGESQMTHAMLFTGVDVDENNKTTKWRVENSWGEKGGDKGYCLMTDDWFNEFMYQVAIHKDRLPKSLTDILESEPIELEPWDPFGALA